MQENFTREEKWLLLQYPQYPLDMDDWKEDEMDSSEFIPEEKEFSIPLPSPKWTKKETPKNNVSEFNKLIIEKKRA